MDKKNFGGKVEVAHIYQRGYSCLPSFWCVALSEGCTLLQLKRKGLRTIHEFIPLRKWTSGNQDSSENYRAKKVNGTLCRKRNRLKKKCSTPPGFSYHSLKTSSQYRLENHFFGISKLSLQSPITESYTWDSLTVFLFSSLQFHILPSKKWSLLHSINLRKVPPSSTHFLFQGPNWGNLLQNPAASGKYPPLPPPRDLLSIGSLRHATLQPHRIYV